MIRTDLDCGIVIREGPFVIEFIPLGVATVVEGQMFFRSKLIAWSKSAMAP